MSINFSMIHDDPPSGQKRKSSEGSKNDINDENEPIKQNITSNTVESITLLNVKKSKLKEAVPTFSSDSKLSCTTPQCPAEVLKSNSTSNESSSTIFLKTEAKKPTSALPRYQLKTRTNNIIAAPATPKSAVRESRFQSTNSLSANRLKILNNGLLKRIKEVTVQSSAEGFLKGFFEKSFTTTLEELVAILTVKTKSKWDLKDKIKRQETAIKEAKEMIITHYNQLNELKITCYNHDARLNAILNDCSDSLQEKDGQIEVMMNNELTYTTRLAYAHDREQELDEKLQLALEEQGPCKTENIELKSKIDEMVQNLIEVESLYDELKTEKIRLQKEQSRSTANYESTIAALKDKCQDIVVQGEEKLTTLQIKLDRAQSDVERLRIEKYEIEKKKSELIESNYAIQSKIRETESYSNRYEKDIEKLSEEVVLLRSQLSIKDSDLRASFNSITELQRMASDEKASLRAEINALQSRTQVLEEERLSSSSQLAGKREEVAIYSRDLSQYKENCVLLEKRCREVESELASTRGSITQLEVEKELRARCEIREENERRERIAATAQSLAMESEYNNRIRNMQDESRRTFHDLENQISKLTLDNGNLNKQLSESLDQVTGLENEAKALKKAIDDASLNQNNDTVKQLGRMTGELEVMKRRVRELTEAQNYNGVAEARKIAEFEEKLQNSEKQRRKLHNLVQELRGNIRVFARVRPFLPSDSVNNAAANFIVTNSESNSVRIAKQNSSSKVDDHTFQFDKIFGQSSTQEQVFQEVSEFVQSALDGYNVCLFSYGQTGSGKTHTMQGCGNGSMRGIIPRAMQQVGVYKSELEAKGWEYQMEVTFIEIYNENIRDLLRPSQVCVEYDSKHEIKKDLSGNVYVSDITTLEVDPNNMEQISEIMELAARHRSVGHTAMNETSSRSHSIFALHLKATNKSQGIILKGTLSLVDLAGSERIERSGVTGAQLKETVSINKSLSALTDVFVAIANKHPHVPFRNSKLTYLLQPALSGDGKTLMMVNLSPTEESLYESLCSLRLAKQVNQCELGKPKKQLKEVSNLSCNFSGVSNSSNTSFSAASGFSSNEVGKESFTSKYSTATSSSTKSSTIGSSSGSVEKKNPTNSLYLATASSSVKKMSIKK